jgi:hypothetical protein
MRVSMFQYAADGLLARVLPATTTTPSGHNSAFYIVNKRRYYARAEYYILYID